MSSGSLSSVKGAFNSLLRDQQVRRSGDGWIHETFNSLLRDQFTLSGGLNGSVE